MCPMPLLSVNGSLLGHFLPINCFYTGINLRMNKDVWAMDSKVVIHETWKESDMLASIWKEGFLSYVPIPWWFKVSFNIAIYSWWYIIWIKLYIHDVLNIGAEIQIIIVSISDVWFTWSKCNIDKGDGYYCIFLKQLCQQWGQKWILLTQNEQIRVFEFKINNRYPITTSLIDPRLHYVVFGYF